MPALCAAPPSKTSVAATRAGYEPRSVHLRTGRAHEFARIDQVFEEKGFSVELQRSAGFAGIPRHHRHVAQKAHDDSARALRHCDMHGSDDRTDLHDISPFSRSRLYEDRAGRGDDKKRRFAEHVAHAPKFLRVARGGGEAHCCRFAGKGKAETGGTWPFISALSSHRHRQNAKPTALLYRMITTHHKPCGTDISKTWA